MFGSGRIGLGWVGRVGWGRFGLDWVGPRGGFGWWCWWWWWWWWWGWALGRVDFFDLHRPHDAALRRQNTTRLRSKPSIQVSYARTYAERITFKHAPELSSTVPGARHSVLARFPFPFPFSTSLMCSVNFLLRSIGFALCDGGASLGL